MSTLANLMKKNKNLMLGMGVTSIVLAGIALSITSKPATSQKQSIAQIKPMAKDVEQKDAFKEKINGTLSVIDKRLSLVQKEMEKVAFKGKDDAPDKALNDLSKTVVSFKEEAQRSLIQSHEENEALAKKIQALQEVIASFKGSKKSIQFLDKKALPFQVISIDSVNEEPILALKYNYNHIALEQGEKLAGWKIINLDYAKQFAEFDDEKGAHVRLSLSDKKEEVKSWA